MHKNTQRTPTIKITTKELVTLKYALCEITDIELSRLNQNLIKRDSYDFPDFNLIIDDKPALHYFIDPKHYILCVYNDELNFMFNRYDYLYDPTTKNIHIYKIPDGMSIKELSYLTQAFFIINIWSHIFKKHRKNIYTLRKELKQ